MRTGIHLEDCPIEYLYPTKKVVVPAKNKDVSKNIQKE